MLKNIFVMKGVKNKMRTQKGQSTAEYAIVISLVIAAIIGMQIYVKRSLQGKVRQMTDYMTIQNNAGGANIGAGLSQYEPYYAGSDLNVNTTASSKETLATGGILTKGSISENTTRSGSTFSGVLGVNTNGAWK